VHTRVLVSCPVPRRVEVRTRRHLDHAALVCCSMKLRIALFTAALTGCLNPVAEPKPGGNVTVPWQTAFESLALIDGPTERDFDSFGRAVWLDMNEPAALGSITVRDGTIYVDGLSFGLRPDGGRTASAPESFSSYQYDGWIRVRERIGKPVVLGEESRNRSFDVFDVESGAPARLISFGWDAGFDAGSGFFSMSHRVSSTRDGSLLCVGHSAFDCVASGFCGVLASEISIFDASSGSFVSVDVNGGSGCRGIAKTDAGTVQLLRRPFTFQNQNELLNEQRLPIVIDSTGLCRLCSVDEVRVECIEEDGVVDFRYVNGSLLRLPIENPTGFKVVATACASDQPVLAVNIGGSDLSICLDGDCSPLRESVTVPISVGADDVGRPLFGVRTRGAFEVLRLEMR